MKHMFTLLRLSMLLLVLTVPAPAHAGGAEVAQIVINVLGLYAPIWFPIVILVSTIIGFTLMVSQDENSITKARSALGAVLIGGMVTMIFVTLGPGTVIGWIYNEATGAALISFAPNFATEAEGIATWIATIAAVAGVLMIIIAGTRAVLSFGDEAQYGNVRTSILHVVIGLLVIGGALTFQEVFFETGTPNSLLSFFLTPLKALIGVIGVIVVGIIIYAGFRMIISIGKEDEFTAARSLIIRALIGLAVMILSFTLIWAVQSCFSGACAF